MQICDYFLCLREYKITIFVFSSLRFTYPNYKEGGDFIQKSHGLHKDFIH